MLDAERMTALDHAWTFLRWQQLLLDAGLLFELPTPTPEPLEPLAEVQDRLTVLRALEERISRFRGPNPFHTGAAPTSLLVTGGLILVSGLVLSLEFRSVWPVWGTIVGVTTVAVLCVGLFGAVQVTRKRQLQRMEALQTECIERLRSETRRLLATPMDLSLPTLRISNTPHKTWLKQRIRELKQRHGDAQLVKDLRAAAERLEHGDEVDLTEFRERLEHPVREGAELDALLP